MIRIELDSVKKYRNSAETEYRYIPRARWNDLEVVGDGWIVRDLCRLIVGQNRSVSGLVHVYRGDTLCFTPMPIKSWVKDNPFAIPKKDG